jgi:esterase/lipase
LTGLSFGGIVAVEVAKIIPVKKIILIASAKTKNELPELYLFLGKLKINKLIPNNLLKQHNFITDWMFGIENAAERQLLKNILHDTDEEFLSWAINETANWKNDTIPANCIHIHGDRDKIIPIKNVSADCVIKNGGHFMTLNKAAEISRIIQREILQANGVG